ncbi:hypothetical protein DFQ27_001306 [Actinomortierella ambigua]|uniref:W2 domain-containing protein n=1 Tax=Actinomortierella ambigua TaxID=1343610 RepID=A0A9P6U7T1_9FUNG|nr:hypothetical protein DFQ27_001306 [Actinomortierella ambigua]
MSSAPATATVSDRAAAVNTRMSYSAIVQSTSFQGNNFRKAASRMAAQVTRFQPQRSHSSSSLPDLQGKHGYYHSRLQHHDYEDDMEGHPHWDDAYNYYNSAQQAQHSLASQALHTPQHHTSDHGATNGQQSVHGRQQQLHNELYVNYDSHSQYPPLSAVCHKGRQDCGGVNNSVQHGHRISSCPGYFSASGTRSLSVPAGTGSTMSAVEEAALLPESAAQSPPLPTPPLPSCRSSTSVLMLSKRRESGLLQGATVDESQAAVAVNSDPEPCGDAKPEQPALQTNVHALSNGHPIDASDRSNASKLVSRPQSSQAFASNGSMRHGSEFDRSSLSSARETSESDDEHSQGSAIDSFEDELGCNARRSKKARSLQRLLRKNRMLESSLSQAQRDLQQERESRKIVDECHLKTRDELLQRLVDKDDENERLQQELEEARKQVEELKQCSYKIGYDSNSYSLSNGFASFGGGLMLHHSSLISGQDDSDEFFLPDSFRSTPRSSSSQSPAPVTAARTANDTPIRSQTTLINGTSDDEVDDGDQSNSIAVRPASCLQDDGTTTLGVEARDSGLFVAMKDDAASSPSAGSDTSSLSQDGGICYPESFELLAKSHLQQAIVAKLTTAMTILQLDDLAMKYDASAQELLTVLINEMAKWWELARLRAGGPAKGGWGPMMANPNGKGITNGVRESVERDFRQYFGPLLFHYISNHQDQLLVLKRLEEHSSTSVALRENQPFQLMAMFKGDILDRDAILEWWHLLEEPKTIFGHGQDIRSLTAKFIAFLETHLDDDDDDDDSEDEYDSEDESDGNDSDDLEEEDEDEEDGLPARIGSKGSVRILGLEQLNHGKSNSGSSNTSRQLTNGNTSQENVASSPEMLVIGSEDGEDDRSTTSSLERLEARERERRISFCAHTTVFGEDSSDEDDDEDEDDGVVTNSSDDQQSKTA